MRLDSVAGRACSGTRCTCQTYPMGERRSHCRVRLDSVACHHRSGTRLTCPRVVGQRTSWNARRSVNPECYWLVIRYFTMTKLSVSLHEDLHPHPPYQMWVDVKSDADVHLANVQVHAVGCVGVLCCVCVCVCVRGGWQVLVGGACARGAHASRLTTTPHAPSC